MHFAARLTLLGYSAGAMQVAKSFGRPPVDAVPADACTFISYAKQPSQAGIRRGTETALYVAGMLAAGWAFGGILPVVGRPLGLLAGAGFAGAKVYSNFLAWRNDGGTTGLAGACAGLK